MKLVTFEHAGALGVGELEGDTVHVLAAPSMRAYFADEDRCAERESVRLRGRGSPGADRPEEVLPHGRKLPRAPRRIAEGRLVSSRRALDRVLPERRRHHRPGRADRLSGAPDERARLRARARRRHREGRQALRRRRSDGLRRAATRSSTTSRLATFSGER